MDRNLIIKSLSFSESREEGKKGGSIWRAERRDQGLKPKSAARGRTLRDRAVEVTEVTSSSSFGNAPHLFRRICGGAGEQRTHNPFGLRENTSKHAHSCVF